MIKYFILSILTYILNISIGIYGIYYNIYNIMTNSINYRTCFVSILLLLFYYISVKLFLKFYDKYDLLKK